MPQQTHCCVFTRGEFYIRDAVGDCTDSFLDIACGVGGPFKKLGNVSSGLIEIQGSVIGRENEFNLADPESRVEILGVNLTLSLSCASAVNLRQALLSDISEVDDGLKVQDFCIPDGLEEDDFFPFNSKGADPDTVAVYLRTDEDTLSTLVEGTDYLVNSSGVQIIRDDIDTIDATIVRIEYNYDTAGYEELIFNSAAPKYKEIYFKGVNLGEGSEDLFDAELYRVLLAPTSQMDLITRDEFLSINLAGTVEKHAGKWFKITKQEQ